MWNQVEFWNSPASGFDLRPVRPWAANTGYPARYRAEHLLGAPATAASLNCAAVASASFDAEASITATRAGTLHGIGGWFSAQLSDHVIMSNSPLAAHPINRHNVFFPIDQPVPLAPGNRVHVKMHIIPSESIVTWNVDIWENQECGVRKAQFKHSTFRGMLICKEDLQRTRPNLKPRLTARGKARLTVLELCDGQMPLSEIEAEVYRRHTQLFRSVDDAATFVAEVVTRYAD
jgi:protein arginine N-methyltransferase 1